MLASCLQCKQTNWKLAVRLLTSKIGSCNMSLFSKCSANQKNGPPQTEGNRWGAYTAKCTIKLSTAGLLLGTKHIHITFDSGWHVQSKTQKKKLVGEGVKRPKEKYHTDRGMASGWRGTKNKRKVPYRHRKKASGWGGQKTKKKYHTFNLSQHKQAWLIAHNVQ